MEEEAQLEEAQKEVIRLDEVSLPEYLEEIAADGCVASKQWEYNLVRKKESGDVAGGSGKPYPLEGSPNISVLSLDQRCYYGFEFCRC